LKVPLDTHFLLTSLFLLAICCVYVRRTFSEHQELKTRREFQYQTRMGKPCEWKYGSGRRVTQKRQKKKLMAATPLRMDAGFPTPLPCEARFCEMAVIDALEFSVFEKRKNLRPTPH
jgi:hypothetical protein